MAECGLIERRPDPNDRRAKRLYLTPKARPLLEQLGDLGEELMTTALAGVEREHVEMMVAQLAIVKENLRQAIQQKNAAAAEQRQTESSVMAERALKSVPQLARAGRGAGRRERRRSTSPGRSAPVRQSEANSTVGA